MTTQDKILCRTEQAYRNRAQWWLQVARYERAMLRMFVAGSFSLALLAALSLWSGKAVLATWLAFGAAMVAGGVLRFREDRHRSLEMAAEAASYADAVREGQKDLRVSRNSRRFVGVGGWADDGEVVPFCKE